MATPTAGDDPSPADLIEARLRHPGGWRSDTLARLRALILDADPDVVEEVKWRKPSNPAGVLLWSHAGMICTGETYKTYVKLTFAHGAALDDPAGLFNAGFGGGVRRAIDVRERETVDAEALKALVRAAVALNAGKGAERGEGKGVGAAIGRIERRLGTGWSR